MQPTSQRQWTCVVIRISCVAFLLLMMASCSTPLEVRTSKEYYETGELKKVQTWTFYEYDFREYYKDGKRRKEVYGTEGNLLVREFYPDGTLKRETKSQPNPQFGENMNFLQEN